MGKIAIPYMPRFPFVPASQHQQKNRMASLIPCIQVPMNFGLEYYGSPSHGNLKFLLKDEVLLANSAIMSFNSPVIKKITLELYQTEIEVNKFSKSVVQCFLEASYSGTLKDISKLNFRDLNKIAHVFEVNWLIQKCFEYFQELTESVREDNFDEQLFFLMRPCIFWTS